MDRVYVGVDPFLTNTGLVVLSDSGKVVSLANTRDALKEWHKMDKAARGSTMEQVNRLTLIWGFMDSVLWDFRVGVTAHIGYENYSFDSTNRAFSLGELGGVLKTELVNFAWDVGSLTLVLPTLLKQFAVGHGDDAGKDQMMEQAKLESSYLRSLDPKEVTNDVCDAYFLAKFAWYKNAPDQVVKNETYKNLLRNRLEIARGE